MVCDDNYKFFVSLELATSNELPDHLKLWITMRCFSLSRAWMEDYKRAIAATTQKKKSLRKQLKQTK